MKKNGTASIAKKARKAFKKDLTEKIATQLKQTVGTVGADLKKNNKAIEKAAKNLAKKLAKQVTSKKISDTVEAKPVTKAAAVKATPAIEKATSPVKTKTPSVKKAAAKAD